MLIGSHKHTDTETETHTHTPEPYCAGKLRLDKVNRRRRRIWQGMK